MPETPAVAGTAATTAPGAAPNPYDAFISYRRLDGIRFARRLREVLLTYRLPKPLRRSQAASRLSIYLDQVYERATADFFRDTVLPALRASNHLVVVQTPAARQRQPDLPPLEGYSGENWIAREIEAFRRLPQRDSISVALAIGAFTDPLPADLHIQHPNVERVRIDRIGPLWRYWPPSRLRAVSDVLPLIARLHDIRADQMPDLQREEDRRAVRDVSVIAGIAFAVVVLLVGLAIWALSGQIAARRAQWQANANLVQAQINLADSLATRARTAREAGDPLSALRLVAEARDTAWSPLVVAEALASPPPPMVFSQVLGDTRGWALAFRPGTRELAVGGLDGSVKLYRNETKAGQVLLAGSGVPVVDLAFAQGPERMVVVRRSPADAAWNPGLSAKPESSLHVVRLDRSGKVLADQRIATPDRFGHLLSADIDSKSGVLVVAADTGVLLMRPAAQTIPLPDSPRRPAAVALSPGSRYAAASTIYGDLVVWDLTRMRKLLSHRSSPQAAFEYNTFRPAFHPTQPVVAFGSFDGTVRLWRLDQPDLAPDGLKVHDSAVAALRWSADGAQLISGAYDGTAAWTDLALRKTWGRVLATPPGLPAATMGLAVSDDGALFATSNAVPVGTGDSHGEWLFGEIRLWSAGRHAARPGADTPVAALSYDSDANLVLLRERPELSLARKGQPLPSACVDGEAWTALAVAQQTRQATVHHFLGTPGSDRGLTSQTVRRFEGNRVVAAATTSRSRNRLFTISARAATSGTRLADVELSLCDLTTGALIARQRVATANPRALGPIALSQDGSRAFLSIGEGLEADEGIRASSLFEWNADGSTLRAIDAWEGAHVSGLAFDDLNERLAVSDTERRIKIIALGTARVHEYTAPLCCAPALLAALPGGRGFVRATMTQVGLLAVQSDSVQSREAFLGVSFTPTALDVTPDGGVIVVGDNRGSLTMLDADTLAKLAQVTAHEGPVLAVRASPDGRQMVSLGFDGLKQWGTPYPGSPQDAERLTRLTVSGQILRPVPREREREAPSILPAPVISSEPDPIAAAFWRAVGAHGIAAYEPGTWYEWLTASDRLRLSPTAREWLDRHGAHPLARMLPFLAAKRGDATRATGNGRIEKP